MIAADPFFAFSNYIEAGVWSSIGVCFAVAVRKRGAARRRCVLAAAVFVIFGGSDVVEAHTGAWWRPWWLLAWKAACVAAMLGLLIAHSRAKRTPP